MDARDDAALVERALRGDRDAFGVLVRAYEGVLFNVALRMVNDREDARDLTQTAFLKAWQKLDTFDRSRKFFSWIYRIVINESINLLHGRRRHEPVDETRSSDAPTPEDECHTAEIGALVGRALLDLPAEQRELVVLRHFLHLSHREMSETLGVPEKTVKSRLYTARQALSVALERRGARPS